jgi:hypothetical protein
VVRESPRRGRVEVEFFVDQLAKRVVRHISRHA